MVNADPHPGPLASQARHQMAAPSYEIASRIVVPRGEGDTILRLLKSFAPGCNSSALTAGLRSRKRWKRFSLSPGERAGVRVSVLTSWSSPFQWTV